MISVDFETTARTHRIALELQFLLRRAREFELVLAQFLLQQHDLALAFRGRRDGLVALAGRQGELGAQVRLRLRLGGNVADRAAGLFEGAEDVLRE